jgi:SAM-dependent methyltransferase
MMEQLPGKEKIYAKWFRSDDSINNLYPSSINVHAKRHWTPLKMAKRAAAFLADGSSAARILDIGSGAGKFCLVASYYFPKAYWYGVEQRRQLIGHAEAAKNKAQLKNTFFIEANFTQLDFKEFDHFYFFNSFYENIDDSDRIDSTIDYSNELYHYYNRYLCRQLDMKPAGTRLAALHSMSEETPLSYRLAGTEFDGQLKLWIKEK